MKPIPYAFLHSLDFFYFIPLCPYKLNPILVITFHCGMIQSVNDISEILQSRVVFPTLPTNQFQN